MKDLNFNDEGDLDLQWVEGSQVLLNSVKRRLATNPVSYARIVRTLTGTQEIGTTFGSTLNQYIAQPENDLNQSDINDIVAGSLAEDSRVTLKTVNVQGTKIQVVFTLSNSQDTLVASIT